MDFMLPQLQEAPLSATKPAADWSQSTRIAFRFVFSYFFLYIAPGAVGALGPGEIRRSYEAAVWSLWQHIVPWVGANLLGMKGSLVEIPNGSGDQLYDWALIFCMAVAALLVTVVWSVLDRRRRNYEQLYQWLALFVRLDLAKTMMIYGASKVLPSQFAAIHLGALVDPLGHLSPMGLLWNFMGYSRAYMFFGGAAELLGGVLLVFPRLTALGSLVSLGVLSNVLMLNLCYDVPRKIFTIHLICMALFLVLPYSKRILNLFVLNRRTEPFLRVPLLKDPQLNRGVLFLQYVYGAAWLALAFYVSYVGLLNNMQRVGSPLRGVWAVERFVSNEVPVPALVSEKDRWNRVIFDTPDFVTIQTMQGPLHLYPAEVTSDQKRLTLSDFTDPYRKATFALEQPNQNELLINGSFDGRAISAVLQRVDVSDPAEFPLTNRGFHWVTPSPRWR